MVSSVRECGNPVYFRLVPVADLARLWAINQIAQCVARRYTIYAWNTIAYHRSKSIEKTRVNTFFCSLQILCGATKY